ncbi:hypothetical protein L8R80_23370 [Vibrio splendidus]|uniref:hypothetical protein n=1 Tax=Vibrio TaxID=662 RepID=UPI00104D822E|nr:MULTISPECIES: hypothetical protein [Vibrio]MDH5914269.1 hypothetical protein [Vibrio splendidus]MDH5944386.1 hypothetical protein [Vibrio splendidus]MDH5987843.1 hypothetical protein [Vibrio splendidus]MDH5996160.1 hypothetical protein [Vibrio splendidus]MDH6007862.1 hypothetical protein [Vibrio splendidus]
MKLSGLKQKHYLQKLNTYVIMPIVILLLAFLVYNVPTAAEDGLLDLKVILSLFAICVSAMSLISNASNASAESELTIFHVVNLADNLDDSSLILYNLSHQDLIIFSIYLKDESNLGWYIQNSLVKSIELDSHKQIEIKLEPNVAKELAEKRSETSITLITSLGELESSELQGILYSQTEVNGITLDDEVNCECCKCSK